jgi:hypothetical protein
VIYLEDDAKLRVFRGVLDEALRAEGEAIGANDLGLPVEEEEVRVDAATMLDSAPLLRTR